MAHSWVLMRLCSSYSYILYANLTCVTCSKSLVLLNPFSRHPSRLCAFGLLCVVHSTFAQWNWGMLQVVRVLGRPGQAQKAAMHYFQVLPPAVDSWICIHTKSHWQALLHLISPQQSGLGAMQIFVHIVTKEGIRLIGRWYDLYHTAGWYSI